MNVRERVEALKSLAADLEAVAVLEEEHAAAKQAYRDSQTPANKEAKRTAALALTLAREAVRESPVKDVEPGGMTITPATVG